MQILVTGGAGFIGSHVVDRMVSAGHEVTVIDDLSSGHNELSVPIIEEDVVEAEIGKYDAVIHCAAASLVTDSPEHVYRTNLFGLFNIMNQLRPETRLIFMSSAAVYEPRSPYARSKAIGETMIHDLHPNASCLRLFNVVGPRDTAHVIPKAIHAAKNNLPFFIYGDGSQVRDYVHVYDVVDTIVKEMAMQGVRSVDVGRGYGVSVASVLAEVAEQYGMIDIQYAPRRAEDPDALISEYPNEHFRGLSEMVRDAGL